MHDFKPKRVYFEEETLKYQLGKELFEKYNSQDIPMIKIASHNNIEELRKRPDKNSPEMKIYIVIGIRKSLTHKKNAKISDYLVPYTSSGCTAMCLYCYLVCAYYKGSYLRLFVNREAMMKKILRADAKSEKPLVLR